MNEMMPEVSFVDFKCPSCGDPVSFPEDCAGRAQECPNCSDTVVVPTDASGVGRRLPLPLNTPRLVLRRLRGTDWKDLLECLADEEMFRYVEGRPLGEEEIIRWLEADGYARLTTPNQPFYLGIERQEGAKLIGYVSLSFTDSSRLQADLNLLVNRNCQRQGFASEAVAALLRFCLVEIGLHRITAHCDLRNIAAGRLLEKSGLRREGEFRKDRWVNGAWIDTAWYAMLGEEYRGTSSP